MHIYPRPKRIREELREYTFSKKMVLTIGKEDIFPEGIKFFRELYKNFTCGVGKLTVCLTNSVGVAYLSTERCETNIEKTDAEYSIKVTCNGAILNYQDKRALAHAFSTLLSLIEARGSANNLFFTLPICEIEDKPTVAWRGIHFCIFPETRYTMIRKFIRFAAFLKYTHIVLEFWGMYKYKCCKYMARKNAFSAKQVKALVEEANALGVEVIPMLNCLGHAAMQRAVYCKHVALDQNPRLAPLFDPDGWTWNLRNPDTVNLLREMRNELIEVCGDGKYFHIGCDEAFPYGSSRLFNGVDKTDVLIDYINSVVEEMNTLGRRVIMWGDQLLYPHDEWKPFPSNIAYAESSEIVDKLIHGLDRSIIFSDWQYYATENPMPTPKFLKENGFDVIIAPFDTPESTKVCIENAVEYNYMGVLQTTWHILHGDNGKFDPRLIIRSAELLWNGVTLLSKMDDEFMLFQKASYYRKLMPPKGKYIDCGIRENDIFT